MTCARPLAVCVALLVAAGACAAAIERTPGARWEHCAPQQAGWDAAGLRKAVAYAVAHESRRPRDLALEQRLTFGREPHGEAIGPFAPRGDMTGVVVHHGCIVAQWGEPARVDMAHSVTKSLLSSVVGVAWDRGLIRNLDAPVSDDVPPMRALDGSPIDLFATPHNRAITWDHLLRQTSGWEGTLWGKPDWADRAAGPPPAASIAERAAPGSTWQYNDVRTNVLALAALGVWRRPLPQVLKETVLDPIGASHTWRWIGYENAVVTIDGRVLASVPGGGHWGGGLFISAHDLARFGLLTLRGGRWGSRQVLSRRWVALALTPTPAHPGYGFMNWYLNRDRALYSSAPASAFAHIGNGANVIFVDPEHDLVVVLRWIEDEAVDGVLARLLGALPSR